MKRPAVVLAIVLTLGGALFATLPLVMVMSVMSGSSDSSSSCGGPGSGVVVAAPAGAQLSERQLEVAGAVISVGQESGQPERAILVALAVASQESAFQNYANDGLGDDLKPDQHGIEASMRLPHDAVGTDHGSLGVFQQQWPWWGSMLELMDPAKSAEKFYSALAEVPGWETMAIGEAGQAVQRSAHPDAYDDDVDLARSLLEAASGHDVALASFGSAGDCAATAFAGDVVMPVAGTDYIDRGNFGEQGSRWTTTHTGTDFSTACGTPVLASTGGVVTVRTDQGWSGRWLVTVDSGSGGVVTWYAHMQALAVVSGDTVQAGEQIGEVGTEGNSTGCHLHFEVRPDGGSPVDPTAWLAERVGSVVAVADSSSESALIVMTANLPFWLSAERTEARIHQLLDTDVAVLMLQEVRNRNIARMVSRAEGQWGVWQPRRGGNHNAIIWDRSRLSMVRRGSEFGADLGSYQRWIPWALLQSPAGILPVVNLHMPNNASTDAAQHRHYRGMTMRYLELISELNGAGLPPIVGGDWNEPLDRAKEPWRPVRALRQVGMTTNWLQEAPCSSTDAHNRRIDGFAFHPRYVDVVDQGCLARGPSDHRPVWMAIKPAG